MAEQDRPATHDTQWPRWEVFKQDTPRKPHQAVGSVHAADPKHALLTARNVFARRPSAVSLWAVPAHEVLSVTQQELDEDPQWLNDPQGTLEHPQTYLVCRKTGHRSSMTFVDHVGEVTATSPQEALRKGLEQFADPEATVWWVLPECSVTRSKDDDIESWFEPAKEKTYKQQSEYGVVGLHPSRKGGGA